MPPIRTSATDPLRVDFVAADALPLPGRLGMTFAPGKHASGLEGEWRRDLDADLLRIVRHYRADVLVSLVEDHELEKLCIPRLFERAAAVGLAVERLPIRDGSIPAQPEPFLVLVGKIVAFLEMGKTMVVHCRGGLGRTGTVVAACLMAATGASAEEAIAATRRARKDTIENALQESFVRSLVLARPRPASLVQAEPTGAEALVPLGRELVPLLGAALGDALGSGVEGGNALARAIAEARDEIGRRFWPYSPFGFAPGEVTDDTQMTLTAIAALREERPDVTTDAGRLAYSVRVGSAYRAWLRSGPPDVGAATGAALADASILGGWRSWGGGQSAGNGSLMRATAPFVAGYRGEALAIAAVVDSAITHPDPRCVAACLWYVATLDAAFENDDPTRMADAMRRGVEALRAADVDAWLRSLAAGAPEEWAAFRSRWPDARSEIARHVDAAIAGDYVDCASTPWTKWPTGFVIDSLRQAAWAALQGTTADEPLRLAVLHGGRDADTIGAIAGGLVGARFGARALEHWSAELLAKARLGHALPGVPKGSILEILRAATS